MINFPTWESPQHSRRSTGFPPSSCRWARSTSTTPGVGGNHEAMTSRQLAWNHNASSSGASLYLRSGKAAPCWSTMGRAARPMTRRGLAWHHNASSSGASVHLRSGKAAPCWSMMGRAARPMTRRGPARHPTGALNVRWARSTSTTPAKESDQLP